MPNNNEILNNDDEIIANAKCFESAFKAIKQNIKLLNKIRKTKSIVDASHLTDDAKKEKNERLKKLFTDEINELLVNAMALSQGDESDQSKKAEIITARIFGI